MSALQQDAPSELLTRLPDHQKWVAIALAVSILVAVVELVRRRKLREEYAFLWIGTGALLLTLALEPRLLNLFCAAIGAKTPIPALLFGALIFLMLVSLLVSLRLSRLTIRTKALTQQLALQRREIEELRSQVADLGREPRAGATPDQQPAQFPAAKPQGSVKDDVA